MVDQYHCWMHLRHALDQHCPVEIITAQPDNSDNFRFSFSHIEKGKKKQVKLTLPVTYQKYYHFNISNVKIGQIFCILYFSILFLKFVCISHAYFKSDYSHFQYHWRYVILDIRIQYYHPEAPGKNELSTADFLIHTRIGRPSFLVLPPCSPLLLPGIISQIKYLHSNVCLFVFWENST